MRTKKALEHEGEWNGLQKLIEETEETEKQWKNLDHLHYSIAEINQNTMKSVRDLKRLAFIHTPVKDHQSTLMWKIHKKWNSNNNNNNLS